MAEADRPAGVSRKILSDAPGEDDKFSGGGHGRTARALARAIRQSSDCDQAIGLEGSWGSGKSTIVNLARQELTKGETSRRYHVFTYDLWTNQTGHFKRSFLEAFLSWALVDFPSKKAKIEKRQAQIADKVKTVDTDLFRRFSWFGVATLFFLYFTPVLYGWLSPAGFKGADGEAAVTVGAKLAWLAIALYAFLLFVAVLRTFPRNMGFWRGLREAISRSLSIFSKEAEQTTVTQTVRDEDPTQYEFHSIFRGIVEELCGANDRIVIVFDNIDRLPQSRIPDAWSEVRGAFYGEVNGGKKTSCITAIVPYARPVALGAFKMPARAKAAETSGNSNKASTDDEYLRADVFRKSFDVIFAVAPPVLSDTAAFFAEKFHEATNGAIGGEVGRRVYRIFDLHVQTSGAAVTPRQVIAFINDVTNWWEQWDGRIPLETIAVFVAHQDKLLANPMLLRSADSIDTRMIQHADQPDIRRDLAALSFNVEPRLAFQILLNDGIRRALVEPDVADLQGLADSASANGFFDILPQVIHDHIASIAASTEEYLNGISNIAALKANPHDLHYTRQSFVAALAHFEEPNLAKWQNHGALWQIVGFVGPGGVPDLVRDLMAKIASGFPDDAKATFEQGRLWIKIVGALLAAIETHHGEEARSEAAGQIALPRGADAVIGAAYDCDVAECRIRDLGTAGNQTALFERLGDYAKGEEAFVFAWPELEFMATPKQKQALLNSAAASLQENTHEFGSDELHWHMRTLTLLTASISTDDGSIDALSKSLYPSGALAYYAHGAQEKAGPDNDVTASTLWLAMLAFGSSLPNIPDLQNRPVFGNIVAADNALRALLADRDPDSGLVRRVAALAIAHSRIGYCFEQACSDEGAAIYKAVAPAICENENLHRPTMTVIAALFDALVPILGSSFENLATCIGEAPPSYWDDLTLDALPAGMLHVAMTREEPGWEALVRKADDLLQAVDQSSWREAFAKQGAALNILAVRNQTSPLILKPAAFFEPLLEYCLAIIAGNAKPAADAFDYDRLSESLPKQSQARLPKEFFERHDTASQGITAALERFEPLLAALPFEKLPHRSIERYLLPLIEVNSSGADEFITEQSKPFRACVKKTSDEQRALLREFLPLLSPAEEEDGAEPDTRAVALRESLGL